MVAARRRDIFYSKHLEARGKKQFATHPEEFTFQQEACSKQLPGVTGENVRDCFLSFLGRLSRERGCNGR